MNLLVFRVPERVRRQAFPNCFPQVVVINASKDLVGDSIDFSRILASTGDPFEQHFRAQFFCWFEAIFVSILDEFWTGVGGGV